MSTARTLAAGYSSEMGLYEVPCDESLPDLGIRMTNEVFQIDERQQDLRESLYSSVRCSVARGPRFFKWKMMRESEPYALLLIQLLITLVTWSLVNDSASSRGHPLNILRHMTGPPR